MADKEHLKILRQGVKVWNEWRKKNPSIKVNLSGADLSGANLRKANLKEANLSRVDLWGTDLSGANLSYANLSAANCKKRKPSTTVDLPGANLAGANLRKANLWGAYLYKAILSGASLSEANLKGVYLRQANLAGANLRKTNLGMADLSVAFLGYADLSGTDLSLAYLNKANLSHAILSGANLSQAYLDGADLREANLSGADLYKANLSGAQLIETNLRNATLFETYVYGASVWNIKVNNRTKQYNLIITDRDRHEPVITVDNIKVAQFIYLLLNNEEIRDVIDTITSKGVLILGRFSEDRKPVLDALRDALRNRDFLPIVFDFERPKDRDFTETIMTLAGMSCFVIADITNPKSAPLELQAAVPDYMIPFVPILQDGEPAFSMFLNLQTKYHWVLDVLGYDSSDTLIEVLDEAVINPALEMRDKLEKEKILKRPTRHVDDYRNRRRSKRRAKRS